jgi:hypothetical protein
MLVPRADLFFVHLIMETAGANPAAKCALRIAGILP